MLRFWPFEGWDGWLATPRGCKHFSTIPAWIRQICDRQRGARRWRWRYWTFFWDMRSFCSASAKLPRSRQKSCNWRGSASVGRFKMRFGIDLGGTKTEIIALEKDGVVALRRRIPTPKDYDM